MKKIVIVSILVLAVAASAFAVTFTGPNRDVKYFKGLSGSFNIAGGQYTGTDEEGNPKTIKGTFYTVAVKGSFGFVPSDRQLAGIKVGVGYSNRNGDEYTDYVSYAISKVSDLIGLNTSSLGLDARYQLPSFNYTITPFYRYKVMDISFIPGLNLWLEAKGEFKQKFTIEDNKFTDRTTTLTLRVHPVIAYDLNEKTSISTAVDILALYGQCKIVTKQGEDNKVTYSAGLQGVNLKTVTGAIVNISIISKF